MPMLTITLQGEAKELEPYLQLISGLSGKIASDASTETQVPSGTIVLAAHTDTETDWTFDEFTRYWNHLSKNAKTFLTELARKPEGYHAPELKQKTGLDTKNLGGACNSASNQLPLFCKASGKIKSKVYDRDGWENNGYVYTMPKAIADFIGQLP